MLDFIKEYFGYKGNTRPVEGYLSWQHILFVSIMIGIATGLAIYLAKKNKNGSEDEKNKVLKVASILMLSFEGLKWIVIMTRNHDFWSFLGCLPLFLCSMQLIALPIAAFAKGKVKVAACNFAFIFGILGAVTGTYLAANYFDGSPVLSFDPVTSVTTHCIAGFAGLYCALVGYIDMKDKKTLIIDGAILFGFEIMALIANYFLEPTPYESNYMFLSRSAGTAFEICNTLVGGIQILYTIFVGSLYFIYMILFILIYNLCSKRKINSK